MTYIYSPSRDAFFPLGWKANYEAVGTWPNDGVEVTASTFAEFGAAPTPAGQRRECETDGTMRWAALPPPPAPDDAAVRAAMPQRVQALLDAQARALGYDSILAAASYADEPSVERYQRDGQALRAWRSAVWAACYSGSNDPALAGMDSDTLLALLPPFPATPPE